MSGQPWGRTGRVVLSGPGSGLLDVLVDGLIVGWACPPAVHPDAHAIWAGTRRRGEISADLPTLDAAVMWVLRRTRPDVWRAERRHVVYVRKGRHGWWRVAVGPGDARDDDLAILRWAYSHKRALGYAIGYARRMR